MATAPKSVQVVCVRGIRVNEHGVIKTYKPGDRFECPTEDAKLYAAHGKVASPAEAEKILKERAEAKKITEAARDENNSKVAAQQRR